MLLFMNLNSGLVIYVSKLFGNFNSLEMHLSCAFDQLFSIVPCQPGSFSPTGLSPCFLCDRRSYQPRGESQVCFSCPGTTITLKAGSTSSQDCIGW